MNQTGPTPTHSDQNPVSGMAVTPSPAEERTEALRADVPRPEGDR